MGRKKKNQHYFLFNSGGLCGDSGDLDAIKKMITEMAAGDADKLGDVAAGTALPVFFGAPES